LASSVTPDSNGPWDGGVTENDVETSLDVKSGRADDLELLHDVVVQVVPRQLEGKRDQRKESAVKSLESMHSTRGGFKKLAEEGEPGDVTGNCLGISLSRGRE